MLLSEFSYQIVGKDLSDSAILDQQPSESSDFMCCHHPLKLSN